MDIPIHERRSLDLFESYYRYWFQNCCNNQTVVSDVRSPRGRTRDV